MRDQTEHRWWLWLPAYSLGLFAFVPALHAAVQLRRRDLWWWAGGLLAADAFLLVVVPSNTTRSDWADLPFLALIAVLCVVLAVVGTGHAFRLHDAVFDAPPASGLRDLLTAANDDPAVVKSRADRLRRTESIELVTSDPGMARDLRIGRPDLVQEYDDGGLVDVNHVPEAVLVSHLGMSRAQARTVVERREAIDGFESVDDLIQMTDLSPRTLDPVRDRIVAL